jgi:hypothetical protein
VVVLLQLEGNQYEGKQVVALLSKIPRELPQLLILVQVAVAVVRKPQQLAQAVMVDQVLLD